MDFLEKLYSNENFGIYLVIAIAVLVVLFFIVLFLGKKDEKKTKELMEAKEKEKALVENNATGPIAIKPVGEQAANESPQTISNIPENVAQPVINNKPEPITTVPTEEVKPVENSVPAFKEVTTEVPVEVKPVEEPIAPEVEETPNVILNESVNNDEDIDDETKEFDFEALADAINKELESIKESKNVEMPSEPPVIEEPKIENTPVIEEKPFAFPNFETVEPDKVPEQVINKADEVKPVIEEKPKMPNVFTSVYVNRNEEKKEEVKPVKPAPFELPKKIDLPKKAENIEEKPIEKTHSFLADIEEESYQIDK